MSRPHPKAAKAVKLFFEDARGVKSIMRSLDMTRSQVENALREALKAKAAGPGRKK